jgi:hypothetical protein
MSAILKSCLDRNLLWLLTSALLSHSHALQLPLPRTERGAATSSPHPPLLLGDTWCSAESSVAGSCSVPRSELLIEPTLGFVGYFNAFINQCERGEGIKTTDYYQQFDSCPASFAFVFVFFWCGEGWGLKTMYVHNLKNTQQDRRYKEESLPVCSDQNVVMSSVLSHLYLVAFCPSVWISLLYLAITENTVPTVSSRPYLHLTLPGCTV